MVKKDEKSTPSVTEDPKGESPVTTPTPNYEGEINSLKETIAKQGTTIEELQEFVTGASAVVNTIAGDEQLKNAFQQTYARQSGVQTQQPQQGSTQAQGYQSSQSQNSEFTQQVTDVVTSQRDTIVRDFEKSYGIDQLPEQDRKEARQKVANYLGSFGWEVGKLPLTSLRDSLDKAYMGSVGYEKLREEGKLEGIAAFRQNELGTMGSFSGGAPDTQQETGKLTGKQKEWLTKLRVKDVDGAEKLYADRQNEQDREKEYSK